MEDNTEIVKKLISEMEEEEQKELTQFEGAPLQLRCGQWMCFPEGIFRYVEVKGKDEPKRVYASYQQILISGIVENIETSMVKYILSFEVPYKDGCRWKNKEVNASECATKRNIIKLSDIGVEVTDGTAAELVRYLADQVRLNRDLIPRYNSISHMGWIDKRFFPDDETIRFSGVNEEQKIVDAIQMSKGSLEDWLKVAEDARKNFTIRILLDASFASVLVEKLSIQCFVVHLWGKSGHGKTVALYLTASIWGMPVTICTTASSTLNAISNRAAFFKNLPILVDEMQLAGGNQDKLIYRLTEGKEKERLGRNSERKEQKGWQLVSITNGEKPIIEDNSGAGAANRVIELETQEPLFNDFQNVVQTISGNYGHAGRLFVEYVKKLDQEELKKEYYEICRELQSCKTTGKQINSVAVLILADRLAGRCIFKGETGLELKQVEAITKSEREISVEHRAYEFALNWVAANRNCFCRKGENFYGSNMLGEINKDYCFVNSTSFKEVLRSNGFSFDTVKKEWAASGKIEKDAEGKYAHKTKIQGIGARYVKLNISQRNSDGFEPVQESLPFV